MPRRQVGRVGRGPLCRPPRLAVAAGLLLIGAAVCGSAGAGPDTVEPLYTMVLEKGLPPDETVAIHLRPRDGTFTQVWAAIPARNNLAYDVDASGLRLGAGLLKGRVEVTVDSVRYDYTVDATLGRGIGGTFRGTYGSTDVMKMGGTVSGEVSARAGPRDPVRFELALGKALVGGNGAQRRIYIQLDVTDGRAGKASVNPEPGAEAWDAEPEQVDVTFEGGKIRGTVAVRLTSRCPVPSGTYTFALDGNVTAGNVSGEVKTRLNGKPVRSNTWFVGTATKTGAGEPKPGDAVYTLSLEKGVHGADELKLCLDCSDGTFGRGVAFAPRSYRSVHRVDATELTLRRNRLRGTVTVEVDPFGWHGSLYRPVLCVYTLDARITDSGVTGTFTGRVVPRQTSGVVSGTIQAPPPDDAVAGDRGYPCWRGPYGNGSGIDAGYQLVDSLHEARLVWKSEEPLPDSWLWSLPRSTGVSGGFASPVVADGRVYLFYYVPSGADVAATERAESDVKLKAKWQIGADDVMLCLDGQTGRTLWKTVFAGKGLNYNHGNAGPFMTPCVAGRRVYGLGSAGRVYCLDAATGEPVWESHIGPEHERLAQSGAEAHKRGAMPRMTLDCCSSPAVVEGVVVLNDNRMGLIGLDAETGRRRWGPVPDCIRKTCSPTVWRHKGKRYIIAAHVERGVCVDPRTGRVLWEVAEPLNQGTVAVSEDYMVTSGSKNKGGISCFRITPKGAEKVWTQEPQHNCHVTSPVIYRGHVYAFGDKETLCIELASGRIVGAVPFPGVRSCSSMVAVDGKVIRERVYEEVYFYDADPKGFRQLGPVWRPGSYAQCTTPTVADGRLFYRSRDALFCYDLRKPTGK